MLHVGQISVYTDSVMNLLEFAGERGVRAITLLADGKVSDQRSTDGSRLVESSSHEGAFYRTSTHSCTCPDAIYRKATCKHQVALRLAQVLKGAAAENENLAPTAAPASNGRVSHGVIPAGQIQRED